jgi:hypothetical protein
VNDLTGSFSVVEEPSVATTPEHQPEISLFSAIPAYDSVTLRPTSVRVTYQVKNLAGVVTDVELVLKVSLNGIPLEDVVLISSGQLPPGGTSGSWDYIPSQGWVSGTYTFRAELYVGGVLGASTPEETLEITAEPAVVNWSKLMIIIGAMLMAITAMIVVILNRRREIIKTWVEDNRSSSRIARRK